MLRTNLLCCFISILALMAPAASANTEEGDWQLRLGVVLVEPDVDFAVAHLGESGASGSAGFGFAVERRTSRRLGLELGALFSEPSIDLDAAVAGGGQLIASNKISMASIRFGLNIHLTPDQPVDLYVGPYLAYVDYGDVRFPFGDDSGFPVEVSSSDNFTVGAQIGADIAFGESPWSFNLNARYLDSSLDVVTGAQRVVSELEFNPLIAGVGLGYRF